MKTLISSSQLLTPLFHSNINPQPKASKTLIPKATKDFQTPNPITKPPKPHVPKASAKGFSGARTARDALSPPAPPKQATAQENDKGSDKNDGGGGEDTIPQIVFERMLVRMGVWVGVPMASGLLSMKLFGEVKDSWNIPIWVQLLTLLLTFGMSSVGLAYGALSSSWEADSEGSLLGFEEAKKNWGDMWREEDEFNENKKNQN